MNNEVYDELIESIVSNQFGQTVGKIVRVLLNSPKTLYGLYMVMKMKNVYLLTVTKTYKFILMQMI